MASTAARGIIFPSRLQERIDALREDEHARGELAYEVSRYRAAKHAASSPSALTPRQQLMQQLLKKDDDAEKMASAPAPAARPKRRARPPRANGRLEPLAGVAATAVAMPPPKGPPPPPPLPANVSPRVVDAIESARGLRVRDPMELCSVGESGFIRRREKVKELSGAPFRTGVGLTEAERIIQAIVQGRATDGGGSGDTANGAGTGESARLKSTKWIGGDFVLHANTHASNATADVAILSGAHRERYLDGARRQQLVGRHRDVTKELSPRHAAAHPSPRETIEQSWKGLRDGGGVPSGHGRARDDVPAGLDDEEIKRGRSMISLHISSLRR